MAQTTLNYLQNRNLFSTYYLESLIKENPEWNEDVTDAFNRAKKLYDSRKESWNRMDESMLEEFLIKPLLKEVLGHHFAPQAKVELGAKRPDYAFFENDVVLNETLEKKGVDDFYLKAVAVGDAKSWKTSLDKKVKGAKGSFEFQNPSYQIDEYLRRTPVLWGILTNGRFWRIYHKETSYKLDSYYEIDLVTILETNDVEGFKYFYLFFRLNAFIKDASGKNFLERVKEGSIAYAKKLGANLQENVYKAMKILSEGFFEWKDNGLLKNEGDLKEVQDNTLKLLYRLLFIFYAESLKLLDRDNPEYKKLSLLSIKSDISRKIDNRELILPVTTNYWNKLNDLFALINEGSESENFRIPKDLLYIPAYNGGLFDPKRNIFLHNKKIGDAFIAKAIDLMAREGKDFIDYSTLGTRQLGSIYEGLLEYKLKVAEEDLVAIKEKGHERWISKKEAQGKKTFDEIKAGAIYLATDKGERKATGSYYTPDYIVKYIVRNTLEPILDEKRKAWKEKGLGERPFLHDILGIRVLDPAMGSGHFLVEACEFLANRLVEAWGEAKPEELESEEVAEHDVHWARREVVRHCIFGVDLNPMAVELAKLSLWLETVAANKPLTFLDHHLKVGNSLIGAQVKELKTLPSKEKKEGAENGKKQLKAPTLWDFTVKKHFEELLVKYGEFAAHPDDDLKSVKQKEQEYDALQKSELNRRLHELANVWTATYFGAAPPPDEYAEMQNEMNPKDFPDWSKWRGRAWFAEAQRLAGEKRFFHWELEFPESFYEKGAPKENPGWDAVVGNPPYFSIATLPDDEKQYLSNGFSEVFAGNSDILYYFMALSVNICARNRYTGYIIGRYFQESKYGAKLRKYLSSHVHLIKHVDFLNYQVFGADVNVLACISIYQNKPPEKDSVTLVTKITDDKATTEDVSEAFLNPKSSLFEKLESPSPYFTESDWKFLSISLKKLEERFKKQTISLDEIATVVKSMETGKNEVLSPSIEVINKFQIEQELVHPIAKSGSIIRYRIEEEKHQIIWTEGIELSKYPKLNAYLMPFKEVLSERHDIKARNANWWEISNPRNANLFFSDYPRILVPFMATGNKFCVDTEKHLNDGGDLRAIFFDKESKISPYYVCAILNSKAGEKYHKSHSKLKRGGYYEYYEEKLSLFPIRRISFTTPPARRAALFEEAKALYSAEAPDSVKKLLDFVGARLSAEPQESDVVHDLLAYLAERMIGMNKEKNAEIKGFLDFLKGEIGASINDLSNKTAIQEYYSHEFQTLIDVLVKNKKKLKAGYDPKDPEPYKHLHKWYDTSVSKLAPLMRRIEATDGLIDAIVYRLYGLTEDEIKIVEESISGDKGREVSK